MSSRLEKYSRLLRLCVCLNPICLVLSSCLWAHWFHFPSAGVLSECSITRSPLLNGVSRRHWFLLDCYLTQREGTVLPTTTNKQCIIPLIDWHPTIDRHPISNRTNLYPSWPDPTHTHPPQYGTTGVKEQKRTEKKRGP